MPSIALALIALALVAVAVQDDVAPRLGGRGRRCPRLRGRREVPRRAVSRSRSSRSRSPPAPGGACCSLQRSGGAAVVLALVLAQPRRAATSSTRASSPTTRARRATPRVGDNVDRIRHLLEWRTPFAWLVWAGAVAFLVSRRARRAWPLATLVPAAAAFTLYLRPLNDHHLVAHVVRVRPRRRTGAGARAGGLGRRGRFAVAAAVVPVRRCRASCRKTAVSCRNDLPERPELIWATRVIDAATTPERRCRHRPAARQLPRGPPVSRLPQRHVEHALQERRADGQRRARRDRPDTGCGSTDGADVPLPAGARRRPAQALSRASSNAARRRCIFCDHLPGPGSRVRYSASRCSPSSSRSSTRSRSCGELHARVTAAVAPLGAVRDRRRRRRLHRRHLVAPRRARGRRPAPSPRPPLAQLRPPDRAHRRARGGPRRRRRDDRRRPAGPARGDPGHGRALAGGVRRRLRRARRARGRDALQAVDGAALLPPDRPPLAGRDPRRGGRLPAALTPRRRRAAGDARARPLPARDDELDRLPADRRPVHGARRARPARRSTRRGR